MNNMAKECWYRDGHAGERNGEERILEGGDLIAIVRPNPMRIDRPAEPIARAITAIPELLDACDEADTAFAVLNLCENLTPQARSALGAAWAKVNAAMAKAAGKPDRFRESNPDYVSRTELVDVLKELLEWDRIQGYWEASCWPKARKLVEKLNAKTERR